MASRRKAIIKASVLVTFIIVAIYVIRFTSVKEFLPREALSRFLKAAGFWVPLAFVLVYTAGICFFVPGTLLTAEKWSAEANEYIRKSERTGQRSVRRLLQNYDRWEIKRLVSWVV